MRVVLVKLDPMDLPTNVGDIYIEKVYTHVHVCVCTSCMHMEFLSF